VSRIISIGESIIASSAAIQSSRDLAKVAWSRAVGVVEKDIGLRTGSKRGRASRVGGDVGGNRRDLNAGCRRDLRAGLFQHVPLTRDDGHVDAFPGEREGAGPSQTSTRAAQQRLSSADSKVHVFVLDRVDSYDVSDAAAARVG